MTQNFIADSREKGINAMVDISAYKCTVIMPTYNKEEYIAEAIESFLKQQTKYNIVLVVSDDCSSDKSMEIAEKYRALYPDKIVTRYAEKNRGPLGNYNSVHDEFRTEYFTCLDPDDYWIDPLYIDKAIDFLEEHKDYSCYSSNTVILEENGEQKAFIGSNVDNYTTESIEYYFENRAIVTHTTASFYRNCVYNNGIPQIIKDAEKTICAASFRGDHDRFLIHLKFGKAFFKNEYVGVYRINSTGIWAGSKAIHRYLLDARAEIDYSRYYDGKFEEQFYKMAIPFYKMAIKEAKKSTWNLSAEDQEILLSLNCILGDRLYEGGCDNNMNNDALISLIRIQKENGWANVFHDAIRGSKWLGEDVSFAPGRWAMGYPGLYATFCVLDNMKPESILELGLGQSTKMMASYAQNIGKNVSHSVVEQDSEWIDSFSRNNDVSKMNIVNLNLKEEKFDLEENGIASVYTYDGFVDEFSGRQFDFILIDGPWGSDYFSRIDVVKIMPDCLKDDFVIIMDDSERAGEARTVQMICDTLADSNIQYFTGVYEGEKNTTVITSAKYKFLCSM